MRDDPLPVTPIHGPPYTFMKSVVVNFGRLTITGVNSSKLSIK